MPLPSSKIALIGGHSAVARQLRAGPLPDAAAFVRGQAIAGERLVTSYHDIGPDHLQGYEAVINCAGAVAGTKETLDRANVELVKVLATACGKAGVARFIHISSFSLYGSAASIDAGNEPRPGSNYGRSKLRGEEAMLELAQSGGPQTVVARFPAIIDPSRRSGKVAQMVTAWRTLGLLPVPAADVRRSMISSALAARVLADLAMNGGPPIVLAADPEPFTYARAATAISEAIGRQVRAVLLPSALVLPLRLAAPGLAASLFEDSLLDPNSNFAAHYPSDLYATIAALALPDEAR